jgi:enolase
VSLACAQAIAIHRKMPLWKSLRQTFAFPRPPRLPYATMNLLNGGAHAGWVADVQEMMVVPKARRMTDRVRIGSEIFHVLGGMLKEAGMATTVGDEGGYAPKLDRAETSLELLVRAIKKAGYKPGRDVTLAVDVASSEFYEKKSKRYAWRAEGKEYSSDKMLERYQAWQDAFPLESIEDPFAEDDWASWSKALPALKKKSVVVGDDFFVTNVARLERGIREKAANAILIKPNQIGTLSETVRAIVKAQEAGWKTSISHRSGETSDTTIADLAVACGSDYIKTGSLSRSERVEKYNRLMAIEVELGK